MEIISGILPGAMLRYSPRTSSLALQWSFGGRRSVQKAWLHSPSVYSCSLSPKHSVSAEASPYYYSTSGNFFYSLIQLSLKPTLLPATPETHIIRQGPISLCVKTAQLQLDSLTQYSYVDVEGVHVVHLLRKPPDPKIDHIILMCHFLQKVSYFLH